MNKISVYYAQTVQKNYDEFHGGQSKEKKSKLETAGKEQRWIYNFLTNRSQHDVNQVNFGASQVTVSVSQGTVFVSLVCYILTSDMDANTNHRLIFSFVSDNRVSTKTHLSLAQRN